jgi:hypothetical protein
MSEALTQPEVDLGTPVEVESPVLQASVWVGPTLTVLPLLAWIALEIFQLLGRAPLLKPSSDRIATAFEVRRYRVAANLSRRRRFPCA